MLSTETILAHFDLKLPIGISCAASSVGIGTVLFWCFLDGSKQPITNVSKALFATQSCYSLIQKEVC